LLSDAVAIKDQIPLIKSVSPNVDASPATCGRVTITTAVTAKVSAPGGLRR